MMSFYRQEKHCMCWQLSALRYFCTAGSRKLLQKTDKRKRKYGADQEPVFAELKTERRRYIQDQYGHE